MEAGEVEVQVRRGQEKRSLALEGAADGRRRAVARASLTKRRLLGIDRSGGPPPATRRGQPLRPFTVPNLVSYVRLALLPVFLAVAFSSDDGRDVRGALLFFG